MGEEGPIFGKTEAIFPGQVFRDEKGFCECAEDSQWVENIDAT
jgi:hypothetical protein